MSEDTTTASPGRRRDAGSGPLRKWAPPVVFVIALVGVWEAAVRVLAVPDYILPAPSQIAVEAVEVAGLLPGHTVTTATEALIGIVSGAAVGVLLAVAIWSSTLVRRVLWPLLVGSQTIPMIVLAPLLVLWFGLGLLPKVIVVALIALFPVAVSTVQGLESADPEQIDLLRSMGAGSRQILRIVLVPTALPGFFAGLRIAAAYAIAGAVIAEWVGAGSGLGLFITRAQTSFRVDRVFVGVGVITLLSVALFGAVHLLARRATPWRYVDEQPPRNGGTTADRDAVADSPPPRSESDRRPTGAKAEVSRSS